MARAARVALRRRRSRRTPRAVFAEVSRALLRRPVVRARSASAHALRAYDGAPAHADEPALPEPHVEGEGLRLVCYKPLFSGPAVERVEELQFQRPQAEVELSRADAERLGIKTGDEVTLSGGGASVTLRARVDKNCAPASRASRASSRAMCAAPSTSRAAEVTA